MFTGIIQAVGKVVGLQQSGGDLRMLIDAATLDLRDVAIGDSVAVSGVCLTAVAIDGQRLSADISSETLARTTLGLRQDGDCVNLEKSLRLADRLGGHLVSGHVDGVGQVIAIEPDARSQRCTLRAPDALARYIAAKGAISVDGVSLTVNSVDGARFGVNLIPHTLAATTLRDARVGTRVNLEVDLIARYVERLRAAGDSA